MTVGIGFNGDQNLSRRTNMLANGFDVSPDIIEVNLSVGLVKHG